MTLSEDEVLMQTISALELVGYRLLPETPSPSLLAAIRVALIINNMDGDEAGARHAYANIWASLPKLSDDWKDHAEPVVGDLVYDVFKGRIAEVPGKIVNIDENGIDIEWEGDDGDEINGLDPSDLIWNEERQGWLR